jgi:hypothetical protein
MSGELGFLDFLHDSIDPMYGSELMSDDFGSCKMDLLSTSLHETGLLHNNQHTEVTILATILIISFGQCPFREKAGGIKVTFILLKQ